MAIPVLRCARLDVALAFYRQTLGATVCWRVGDDGAGYAAIELADHVLHLSSHAGDSMPGAAVVLPVDDVDRVYAAVTATGWRSPAVDSPVELAPVDQSWGTREWYVRDPDRNCLRFVAGLR